MSLVVVSAIVISIALGYRTKINTGFFAIAFAYIIGCFILDLKAPDVVKMWPINIFFVIFAVSLFYNFAIVNGTLEKLAGLDSSFPGIVRGCARDSANVERRLWAEREAQAEEDMRAWGVEVTTLSEAEMQKFRAAVRPMYERFAEQAELIRQIQEA